MHLLASIIPLVALLGVVIPVTRGADHQVTVGGIGILKYDPEFIVRVFLPRCKDFPDSARTDGRSRRYRDICLQAEEPHRHSVDLH